MTDLQKVIIMLSATNHEFEKKKVGKEHKVSLLNVDIEITFKEDESIDFIHNKRRLQ